MESYKKEILEWKSKFESIAFPLFKGKYLPRYYQHVATERTLDAIAAKKYVKLFVDLTEEEQERYQKLFTKLLK
jgi:hypothetical protein